MDRESHFMKHIARVITLVLFAIFLTAKVPSSKCHCNDKSKTTKSACPFGVLRTLTFVQSSVAPQTFTFVTILLADAVHSYTALSGKKVLLETRSRSPPK